MSRPTPAPRGFAQRALQALSWAGLAVSLLILTFSAPRLLEQGGGAGLVLGNVAQYGWTIALLALAFAWTRTIGLRALAGAVLAGFFGVASLAVLIGKPLVDRLGSDSPYVTLLFAPVTEELLKLLPGPALRRAAPHGGAPHPVRRRARDGGHPRRGGRWLAVALVVNPAGRLRLEDAESGNRCY